MRFSRAALIAALSIPALAEAQTVTPLNTLVTGATPPSGFTLQPFNFNCTSGSAACWPLMQIYDGTTRAIVGTNGGLDVNILGTVTVVNPAVSTFGSGGPASGAAMGTNGQGPFDPLIQAHSSVAINITTAVTTQLVALTAAQSIYVTSWDVMAPSGNFTLEYGTGTLCGTGTTALTGPEAMNGGQVGKGTGLGTILPVPASNALCAVTDSAVQYSGSVSYTKF